ncbi:MAG: amidohydrolase family protein [Bacteroidota bacterium]
MVTRRAFTRIHLPASLGLLAFGNNLIAQEWTEDPSTPVRKIPKTDTHMHLFGLEVLEYPWLANAPEINKTFLPEDFIAASRKSNIGKIVFMESGSASDSLKEIEWVIDQAEKDDRIKGIVASGKLQAGGGIHPGIEALMETGWVKGIRGGTNAEILASQDFVKSMRLLGKHNMSMDLLTNPSLFSAIVQAVKQVPGTRFILDHLGNPDIKNNDFDSWSTGINELAKLPNLTCKISGIITRAGKGWTIDMLRPYVLHVIEQFGPDRLVYGGDWPVVLRAGSYLSWSKAFEQLTRQLTKEELQKIYYENADRIYQLV